MGKIAIEIIFSAACVTIGFYFIYNPGAVLNFYEDSDGKKRPIENIVNIKIGGYIAMLMGLIMAFDVVRHVI